jgi:MFS superfamily sulfate permease-like transporter
MGRAIPIRKKYVPIVDWLRGDIVAALSVWALLVPQALAYSSIAGVPAEYGLYAAFAALVAYALLGTSRQLVHAPPQRLRPRGQGRGRL